MTKRDNAYGLEPHEESATAAVRSTRSSGSLEAEETEPAGQEPMAEPAAIKALDVCPNCGSPMPSVSDVLCLRCGFNTRTLRVEKTASGKDARRPPSGEPQDEQEEAAAEEAEPLCRAGRGDMVLPGIIAAVGALVLAICYLSGAGGLFGVEEGVTLLQRLGAAGAGLLRIVVLTGCGLAGVVFLARFVHETTVGDLALAALRVAAIVAAAQLVLLFKAPAALEFPVQFLVQMAVGLALAMYFFSLDVRDAALATLATVAGFLVLLVVSRAVLIAM
jgi:hypothetical protein